MLTALPLSMRLTSEGAIAAYVVVGFFALIVVLAWAQIKANRRDAATPRICPNPNCAYRGPVRFQPRGSTTMLIVLFCIGVLPGLIYLMFFGGHDAVCPKCNLSIKT